MKLIVVAPPPPPLLFILKVSYYLGLAFLAFLQLSVARIEN